MQRAVSRASMSGLSFWPSSDLPSSGISSSSTKRRTMSCSIVSSSGSSTWTFTFMVVASAASLRPVQARAVRGSRRVDFRKYHDGQSDSRSSLRAVVPALPFRDCGGGSTCQHFELHLSFAPGNPASRSSGAMFPKNGWYAAIWSKDLTGEPVGAHLPGRAGGAVPRQERQARRARGSLLPSRGAAVAGRGRGRSPALRLSRPDLRHQRAVRFSPGAGHRAVGRAGARLSGRRALQRGLDLDGRSGARRRLKDRRTALARRQGLDADARAICASMRMRSSWSTISSTTPTSRICIRTPSPAIRARPPRRPRPSA